MFLKILSCILEFQLDYKEQKIGLCLSWNGVYAAML